MYGHAKMLSITSFTEGSPRLLNGDHEVQAGSAIGSWQGSGKRTATDQLASLELARDPMPVKRSHRGCQNSLGMLE